MSFATAKALSRRAIVETPPIIPRTVLAYGIFGRINAESIQTHQKPLYWPFKIGTLTTVQGWTRPLTIRALCLWSRTHWDTNCRDTRISAFSGKVSVFFMEKTLSRA